MSKNKKKKKKPIKAQVVPTPLEEEKKFVCLRCGFCCICSTPAFTREEYKKVRDLKITRERNVKFTKVKFGTLVSRFNKRITLQEYAYFTQKGVDTLKLGTGCKNPPPCEFLDKDDEGKHFCAIYPYRPSVCRDFGVKEWACPNNPDYLKKTTKWCCLF